LTDARTALTNAMKISPAASVLPDKTASANVSGTVAKQPETSLIISYILSSFQSQP
jgi:hypothetical protein